jgi:hypothetical protein
MYITITFTSTGSLLYTSLFFIKYRFDAEAFAAAAGDSGVLTLEAAQDLYFKSIKHSALIFIKPHGK